MAHRWTPDDVARYRKVAEAALAAAGDAAKRGAVRKGLLDTLQRAVRSAYKASFPVDQADWPRLLRFLELSENYATSSSDLWRGSWTAALDTGARDLLARLGEDPSPPAPAAGAAADPARKLWWVDGK